MQLTVTQQKRNRGKRQRAARWAARSCFSSFFKLYPPNRRYIYGRHTDAILELLDGVVRDVRAGRSRYLMLNLPFRHGKSDVGSRRWAPFIMCSEPPDSPKLEILLASYNYEKAAELSYDARSCFSEAGAELCGYGVQADQDRVGAWTTERGDTLYAAGIGGTITGRGAHYLVLDDYYKNRVEAESQVIRNKVRESFRGDMLTRLAPVHAVVIIANRWHPDGLCSWIERSCTPGSGDYDKDFPKFDVVKFPAQSDEWASPENPDGWLFPERYSSSWYKTMRAGMSGYAWQAQAQQEPRPRQGNLLRADQVKVLEAAEFYELTERLGVRLKRGWDLASSSQELDSTDPDYTVGTLAGYVPGKIFVDDVVRLKARAPLRDTTMQQTAMGDGPGTTVRIESVAGYKDTHDRIASQLQHYTTVEKVVPDRDKIARASVLEAPFESGQVYIKRAPWNDAWLQEVATFPAKGGGLHIDQVDSLVIAVYDEIMQLAQTSVEVW